MGRRKKLTPGCEVLLLLKNDHSNDMRSPVKGESSQFSHEGQLMFQVKGNSSLLFSILVVVVVWLYWVRKESDKNESTIEKKRANEHVLKNATRLKHQRTVEKTKKKVERIELKYTRKPSNRQSMEKIREDWLFWKRLFIVRRRRCGACIRLGR